MFQRKYSYKQSGVDIKKADEIIKNISQGYKIDNFKNFAGVFNLKNVNLVSCCDGIGSKIIPLIDYNLPEIIANDLIAMNINDLVTKNAKPLFFLDYIATNTLKKGLNKIIENTIKSLQNDLKDYDCTLIGGEISEIGSLIKKNYFDIAGFMVGQIENPKKENEIKNKDVIAAFPSNGVHSNGFSLIRKLYKDKKISENIFKSTLKPTKIYYKTIKNLYDNNLIKASCNITGGGIYNNIKRIVTRDFRLDIENIPKQEIFEILLNFVDKKECFNVFNMGAGFCVIADKNDVDKILKLNKDAFILGEIL